MVVTTQKIHVKKPPAKLLPKLPIESSYEKICREAEERDAKKAANDKQKALDDAAEEARMHKLILPYLDNLQNQLEKKGLLYFWVYPDEPGFVKHTKLTDSKLQKIFYKNVEKYKNRLVASISICFYHHDDPSSVFVRQKTYMTTGIEVIHIDKNGKMHGEKDPLACGMSWSVDDFKTTKFSFKLIELIYRQVVNKVIVYPNLYGYPIKNIIQELQKKGLDFGTILKPLPGANL